MKKKKSGGILTGLILILIGICVLWYNEGRTVETQAAINEAKKQYTDISSTEINPQYDNKIIATTGDIDLTNSEMLVDDIFEISIKSSKLKRVVEMYEWEEECTTDSDNYTTCTYNKVWSESLIDSDKFEQPGYTNPKSMPYNSKEIYAENVKVGAFTLTKELISDLKYNQTKTNEQLNNEYNGISEYNIVGEYLTTAETLENPEIGTIRISFKYNVSSTVSILAVQKGNTFEEYKAKNGKPIYTLREGKLTGEQILQELTNENNMIKWILRVVGLFLNIFGISSIFSPLTRLSRKVPILGSLIGYATGTIAFILGTSLSLIVIAIAWFRFRPILSLILIIIVAGLIILLKKSKKENQQIDNQINYPENNQVQNETNPTYINNQSAITNNIMEQQVNNINQSNNSQQNSQ